MGNARHFRWIASGLATAIAVGAALAACGSDAAWDGGGATGADGGAEGSTGVFGTTDAAPSDAGTGGDCAPNLTGRLRDFVNKPGFVPATANDDDFNTGSGDDRGIVATDLGADLKPVYKNAAGTTPTTHGKAQFDWWYRDTPGKNQGFDFPIVLTPIGGGISSFNDQAFFPLDGRGWNDDFTADDGKPHNFSFTFELHTTFAYAGGEVFTFIGDDDVFVFIDKKLVVDLGGIHEAETKSVNLDALVTDDGAAAPVPLVKGTTYPLDIFYNERHTTASHFRMDTSITFNNCAPIIIPN